MWLWALLPISLAIFGSAGIWAVFAIAVRNGSVNVTSEIPYISTCGSFAPQSTLFSQVCNICSFLALWIVVIRYQQVKDFGKHGPANNVSIVFGMLSAIGISLIGNFQSSIQLIPHMVGAFLAFVLGTVFFWAQLYLTYRAKPSQCRHCVGPIRAIICTIDTALLILMVVLHLLDFRSEAAVCEWVFVLLNFVLFGLFAVEFSRIDFHRLSVQKKLPENIPVPVPDIRLHYANYGFQ